MKKTMLQLIGVCLLLLTLGILMGFGTPRGADTLDLAMVDLAQAHELLNVSREAGHITFFACSDHEAEVTPQFWADLNARQKKGLTISLAKICLHQQYGEHITILDKQSGEPLALFAGGFYRTGGTYDERPSTTSDGSAVATTPTSRD